MKTLEMTNGMIVHLDDEDHAEFSKYRWPPDKDGYPRGWVDGKNQSLHQLIGKRMGLVGDVVDHKDRNIHNCTRSNLRGASNSQSNINTGPQKRNKLKIKGVRMKKGKFTASIGLNNSNIWLGSYDTLAEARVARKIAERLLYKEFATV